MRKGAGEGGRRGREEREGGEGGRRGREEREGGEGGRRGREEREGGEGGRKDIKNKVMDKIARKKDEVTEDKLSQQLPWL